MAKDVKKFTKKKFIDNIDIDLHREFFAQFDGRIQLDLDGLDHETIYNFLLESGDSECPPEVMESLHRIHDLASPEGMDLIEGQAEQDGAEIVERDEDGNPRDITVAEMAFITFLRHQGIFDKAHDLFFCHNVKSPAEYAGLDERQLNPTRAQIGAFKKRVTAYFNERYKGKYCEVRPYPDEDEINIVIYHGKHLKSGTFIIDELPKPTRYRDAKQDMVSYASVDGRLKVLAATETEKDDLARLFGECFFGDPDFFMGEDSQNLYTLEPLEQMGTDFEFNYEWDPDTLDVKIDETQVLLSPKGTRRRRNYRSITVKDFDCIETLKRHQSINIKERDINYARIKFVFLFNGRKKKVTVKLKPPNLCQFDRRMFEDKIMEHLRRNGFIVTKESASLSA